MLSKDEKNRKAQFIETMKGRILSGELRPGDRIRPERELAAELGLSRGSVNQGMLDLARMGFLRIVPRKGAFVAEYVKSATPDTLASIMSYDSAALDPQLFRDFMEFRILIERECTRLACEKLTPETLALLRERTDAVCTADENAAAEAVYLYHKCLVDISGNAAYSIVFRSFEKMIRNLISEHYKDRAEFQNGIPKIRQLTAAIEQRDAGRADRCILSLLGQASDYLEKHLSDHHSK